MICPSIFSWVLALLYSTLQFSFDQLRVTGIAAVQRFLQVDVLICIKGTSLTCCSYLVMLCNEPYLENRSALKPVALQLSLVPPCSCSGLLSVCLCYQEMLPIFLMKGGPAVLCAASKQRWLAEAFGALPNAAGGVTPCQGHP